MVKTSMLRLPYLMNLFKLFKQLHIKQNKTFQRQWSYLDDWSIENKIKLKNKITVDIWDIKYKLAVFWK